MSTATNNLDYNSDNESLCDTNKLFSNLQDEIQDGFLL